MLGNPLFNFTASALYNYILFHIISIFTSALYCNLLFNSTSVTSQLHLIHNITPFYYTTQHLHCHQYDPRQSWITTATTRPTSTWFAAHTRLVWTRTP